MIIGLFIYLSLSIQNPFNHLFNQSFLHETESPECIQNRSYTSSFFSNNVVCIIKCNFKSIRSNENGGAVVISLRNRFGTKNFIDKCTFTDCHAINGGAIYFNIEKNFSTEILNSVFLRNSADTSSGGAIYITSNIKCNFKFQNCTFKGNSGKISGGSLYFNNISYIFIECTFINNRLYSKGYLNGGAILSQNSNGSLLKCIFDSNLAHSNLFDSKGGAISFSNSPTLIQKCSFINNSVYLNSFSSYYAKGGSIFFSYQTSYISFSIDECIFNNNCAFSNQNSYGGTIYISIEHYNKLNISLLFSKSIFANNKVSSSTTFSYGGAFYSSNRRYVFLGSYLEYYFWDCIFTNNTAYSYSSSAIGGAFYMFDAECKFTNCTFNNNNASTFLSTFLAKGKEPCSNGGALFIQNSDIMFIKCNFNNNSGYGNSPNHVSTGKGGAIWASLSEITLSQSSFNNNTLFCIGDKFDIDCFIEGGACYFLNSNANISNCNFINNSAKIFAYENSIYFSARIYGGAIYSHTSKQTLNCTNCIFKKNIVYAPNHEENEFSGAVYLVNGTFEKCTFNDNAAYNGGDIRYDQINYSLLKIIKCNFKHNQNYDHKIKSLIHCRIFNNITSANAFIDNKVVTNILSYLFDGEIESKNTVLKFNFENNCMSPFDKGFYISNEIFIYDSKGKNHIDFNSAFKSTCNEYVISQTMPYVSPTEKMKTYKLTPSQIMSEQLKTQSQKVTIITQINTHTKNESIRFTTQTKQIMTQVPSQTKPFLISTEESNGSKKEKIEFHMIFIMLIVITTILVVLLILIIILFVLILKKKVNQNDLIDPLIDLA